MKVALDEVEIVGVPTTIPLHRLLMRDEGFIQGNFNTTYLNTILPQMNSNLLRLERYAVAAAATSRLRNSTPTTAHRMGETSRWRMSARTQQMTAKPGW